MYSVKILADSIAPNGQRLTTWELTYPRFVHSELMTHRLFSRNSASSRAIPTAKLINRVMTDPALPVWWGKNQTGMQALEELDPDAKEKAIEVWLKARDTMVGVAEELNKIGLHKQIANRVIEPWMFITVIVSATCYENFFHLRCHPDAQPEIGKIAKMMFETYISHVPTPLASGEWHVPLIDNEDIVRCFVKANGISPDGMSTKEEWANATYLIRKVSVGRCARVSYLTHDGIRDINQDIELHDKLKNSGHWSPFEHVAMALDQPDRIGNFIGWLQYRKCFENEHYGGLMP